MPFNCDNCFCKEEITTTAYIYLNNEDRTYLSFCSFHCLEREIINPDSPRED